jgi:hypothetical protein
VQRVDKKVHGSFFLISVAIAATGCDSMTSSHTPDATPDAVYCPPTPATTLDVYDSGLVTGDTRIPVTATPGDLLVLSIATESGGFGRPVVANGTRALQLAMGTSPCGRSAISWTVGNIEAPLDHVDVQMDTAGTYDVFIARFVGLPPDAGTHVAVYSHLWSGEAAPWSGDAPHVSVCGGTAVVSTMVSCAPLSLRSDSPFKLIGSAEGMASAAYIPTEPGPSGADWDISDQWSAFVMAFPRLVPQ